MKNRWKKLEHNKQKHRWRKRAKVIVYVMENAYSKIID